MTDLLKALLIAQKRIEGAQKDSTNPHFRSKYADLESVMDAIKTPLNDAGIIITQPIENIGGEWCITSKLTHAESGQEISCSMPILSKDAGDPQKWGSAVTYARRYTLSSLVALPAIDDDGNEAARGKQKPAPTPPPRSDADEDLAKFTAFCSAQKERIGGDRFTTFLAAWKVTKPEQLPQESRKGFAAQLKEIK